jgi:hypothetical protein
MAEKTELDWYQELVRLSLALAELPAPKKQEELDIALAPLQALHRELETRFNVFIPPALNTPTPVGKLHLKDWLQKMALRSKN